MMSTSFLSTSMLWAVLGLKSLWYSKDFSERSKTNQSSQNANHHAVEALDVNGGAMHAVATTKLHPPGANFLRDITSIRNRLNEPLMPQHTFTYHGIQTTTLLDYSVHATKDLE